MSETKKLLEELDGKVTVLLTKLSDAQQKTVALNQEISNLKGDLQTKETQLVSLKNENEALKEVKPDTDQEDLKVKISEMVNEIDRCISLLKD